MSHLSCATGMRDLNSNDVRIRDEIFGIAKDCYIKRGAQQIDTPAIEKLDLVKNLYGEEFDKLVYNLKDSSDESDKSDNDLILRYDLTVPLARYVAMNGLKIFKRFQIGKVYRRDQPQISKGRYREFQQIDYDIIGDDLGTHTFDIEVLDLMHELLNKLIGNNFQIRFNHREILYDFLKKTGIDTNKIITVCSSLDKLDKKTLEEINLELKAKLIPDEMIEKLNIHINNFIEFSKIKDKTIQFNNVIEYLDKNDFINSKTKEIIDFIIRNLKSLGIIDNFIFDPLLARGMDYYTGIIYEANYCDLDVISSTIAAGGRYDKMIGKFSNSGDVPAIGLSIGVERIAVIREKMFPVNSNNNPQIYVASAGKNMLEERIKLCSKLRRLGFRCVMSHTKNPKMGLQFDDVFNGKIPYMVVIGENEIANNRLTIKQMDTKIQSDLPFDDGIKYLCDNLFQ
jgi:histidyl-tRNA synthetase